MSEPTCPLCTPVADRVFYRGSLVRALWDVTPVTKGHALLTTNRHAPGWFEATPDEQLALLRTIAVAKAAIEAEHQPHGYTIGIDVGESAGQAVPHLHIHIIPRYPGIPNGRPTGLRDLLSIRHLGESPTPSPGPAQAARPAHDAPGPTDEAPRLVRGGTAEPLLPHLISALDDAESVSIAAAFTMSSGVRLIQEHLRDVLEREGSVRLLTGDYLGVTEPDALLLLLDLQGNVEIRVFESAGTSFHPKAYVVTGGSEGVAFVGSSNLSGSALRQGIEWNYRVVPARDEQGFAEVQHAFEELWTHPKSRLLDADWVQRYRDRRTPPEPKIAGVASELPLPPAVPHAIQEEALKALEATREAGNTAGLVVLATGLGKTWLSAFDSHHSQYKKVLFVAHREEILSQSLNTFRRIRPQATLGLFNGTEKAPQADVLFASIQTLSRHQHLHAFNPRDFDYLIVDEFHHAAARSYRRVINYFEPQFLLGLTATPERTDGADLLSLCGGNLVYRADLAKGIRQGLLCPFQYFGVPDDVDYDNIPWRSNRFDEKALTAAVATEARAQNALEQLEKHGLGRTVAFCVSQRHADYMAEFFQDRGLRAVAVHSGPSSAPRAHSLERLEAGDLDVVCSVDMFNEGVDLPHVNTILMLRPTESRILWQQQFGRGLRHLPDKTLRVIDYIGNHRVFLTKTRALLGLGGADREVAYALEQLENGTLELPPGCSVTYDLRARDILRSLLRSSKGGDQLEEYYKEFRDLKGVRPLASEVFRDGFNPRATRRAGQGSWLDFVQSMGDLDKNELDVRRRIGAFVDNLGTARMKDASQMLVLQAMLGEEAVPGSASVERIVERFTDLARRSSVLRSDVGPDLNDPDKVSTRLLEGPIAKWTEGSDASFDLNDGALSTRFSLPAELHEAAQDLVGELVEWRLAEYMQGAKVARGPDRFVCRVSHANDRPILFLPDRKSTRGLPESWTDVEANGQTYQANFVKVAVNVMQRPGGSENVLPELLRTWFGSQAGQPGRTDAVQFEITESGYRMTPLGDATADPVGPVRWMTYTRDEAFKSLDIIAKGWDRQVGVVDRPDRLVFFVTLDKKGKQESHQYKDSFLSDSEFQWQSQNSRTRDSDRGQRMESHQELGIPVHLFVRKRAKVGGTTQKFYYAGTLDFQRWEGDQPITIWWKMDDAVPERLWEELGVG